MFQSVSGRYRAEIEAGRLLSDPDQEGALVALHTLEEALTRRPNVAEGGPLARLLGRKRPPPPAPPGLYLWGGVGRGKTMLMDLFFASVAVERKRRVHFHDFMLETHRRLHAARARNIRGDAAGEIARKIAEETRLLCFDEFHVEDVADAMILGRLFTALLKAGTVVVATSNHAPEDLYKDGLQRPLFSPFITLVRERMIVVRLGGTIDHRLDRLNGEETYLTPPGSETTRAMDALFATLTEGTRPAPVRLPLPGRHVEVPRAARGIARFTFDEICGRPLGAADHIAIAERFRAVMIDDVPVLTEELRNEAKRFITLVDVLYERRVRMILSAAAPLDRLFAGRTHALEFDRTASRLMEMRSSDYGRESRAA